MNTDTGKIFASGVRLIALVGLLSMQFGCASAPATQQYRARPAPSIDQSMERIEEILQEGDLLTFELRMDPTDAQVLFRKDPFDNSTFPATLVVDGEHYPGRVEVMGSSSRRLPKKSILIKLDKDKLWRGQRRIALDGLTNDPSMLKERLAWDTIQALEMTAPEVRFRRLDINGEFIGLFLQVEWIDTAMFARQGLGGDGQFFTPDSDAYCGDLSTGAVAQVKRCWNKLAPGDADYQPVAELGRAIAATPIQDFDSFLDRHFDSDSVLDWILVNTLTANGDTYNKNYFLYRSQRDQRWTVVPFDYDLAFGNNFDPFLPYPGTIFNDNFIYYFPPDLGAWSPLKEKVLRNDRLRSRLMARLLHLMGIEKVKAMPAGSFGLWHPEVMAKRIGELEQVIKPFAAGDMYRPVTPDEFSREVEALKYFTRSRWNYLNTKLFGAYPWNPEDSYWGPGPYPEPTPLPKGLFSFNEVWQPGDRDSLLLIEAAYGQVMAFLDNIQGDADAVLRISAELEMDQAPAFLPSAFDPDQCVQRTWYFSLKSPVQGVKADLTLEYLQENSRRNELGSRLDEQNIQLWAYRNGRWEQVDATSNSRANIIRASAVDLSGVALLPFVACSPLPETGDRN